MKNKQAASEEIRRLKKVISIKDREMRRWSSEAARDSDLGKHERKRLRRETRELLERIAILEKV